MERRGVIQTSVVTAVLVAVLAALAWVVWPVAEAGEFQPARARVVAPADCGSAAAGELVRLETDGYEGARASLNSCGHGVGDVLDVEVRTGDSGLDVRLAGTGVSAAAVTAQKLSAILLVLAAAGSAGLAWRLCTARPQQRAVSPGRAKQRAPVQGRARHRHRATTR